MAERETKAGGIDRWDLIAFGSIFILAFGVRALYVHQIDAAGLTAYLRLDPRYYYQWALKIAAGEGSGREVFEMSPLYAYVLAVLFRIAGTGLLLPRIIQGLVASLVCAFLGVAGRRAFGKAEGLLAGCALALYGPAIFHDGQVMKTSFEVSFATLATLAFFAACRGGPDLSPRWVFLGGVLLGITALMRENILVAAPLFLTWALWPRAGASRRGRVIAGGALAAAILLPILPATIRNVVVAREWVLITALGGENFYTGNNEIASGRYTPPPFVRPDPQYEHEDFRKEAVLRVGRPLTRREASDFWYGEGLRFITSHPRRYLVLLWDKFGVFWNDFERPDNFSFYNFKRFSALLNSPLPHFAWVAPLGLLGIALSAPRWRDLLPFHITLLAFVASALIFFTQSRYRMPAVPILTLFGAHACVALVDAGRRLRLATLAWCLPPLAIIVLFVTQDPGNTKLFEAHNQSLLAEMNLEAGRLREADAGYRACITAVGALPAGVTAAGRSVEAGAHLGLARTLLRMGDESRALDELRLAAESPREDVRFGALSMLGLLLGQRGNLPAAAEALRRAVEERPSDFETRMLYAEALDRTGRPREALSEVQEALRIRPLDPEALRIRDALSRNLAGAN